MLQQTPYGASAYRAIGIETGVAAADPLGLVVMLYDGAIQAIARADSHLAQGDIEARGLYTSKAIDIIKLGLAASLDPVVGGKLAESLGALYDYMGRRLFEANRAGDPAIFDEVRTLLLDLRASWVALRLTQHTNGRGHPATDPIQAYGRSIAA